MVRTVHPIINSVKGQIEERMPLSRARIPSGQSPFEAMQSRTGGAYVNDPLPCPLDGALERLIQIYVEAVETDTPDRMSILEAFDLHHSSIFLAFAHRMAELAVREKSTDRIRAGLMALVIEGFKSDWRENLMELSLLHHSAQKIGADAEMLFRQAASYADSEAAKWLTDFLLRSPENQSIRVTGYLETQAPDGFRYQSNLL